MCDVCKTEAEAFEEDLYEFIQEKLDEGHNPALISHTMAGHAVQLGLDSDVDPRRVTLAVMAGFMKALDSSLKHDEEHFEMVSSMDNTEANDAASPHGLFGPEDEVDAGEQNVIPFVPKDTLH